MTSTAIQAVPANVLSDFIGGGQTDVAMMIGIGVDKDSEAVYFQYLGNEQKPSALLYDNGRPVTRLADVVLHDISVVHDIGSFKSSKLNLFLRSSSGVVIMLTAGLQSIWSQCVITGLMGMATADILEQPFALDTWKGNSKMKPCFAAVRTYGQKHSHTETYEALGDARADGNKELVKRILSDSIEVLHNMINDVDCVAVNDVTKEEQY